ncbi:MAG: lipid-A-disaccharide synthase, partial [Fimbriimonadales bacterium]
MSQSVLIVAGEASGDLYGADLARQLQARLPDVALYGVGGARMQAAGVQLIADSRAWGAIGVVESLKVAPKVYLAYRRVQQFIRRHPPDLFVPIDCGAFNIPLSCWASA